MDNTQHNCINACKARQTFCKEKIREIEHYRKEYLGGYRGFSSLIEDETLFNIYHNGLTNEIAALDCIISYYDSHYNTSKYDYSKI